MTPEVAACLAPTTTEHGASRDGEYRRCPRAHHIRFHLRIAPKREAVYFGTGHVLHGCMQYMQLGAMVGITRDWRDVIEAAREIDAAEVAAGTKPPLQWDEPDPIDEAERLMGAYWAFYGTDNASWPDDAVIVDVERLMQAEIGGYPVTARADTVLRLGGEIVIPDHKTRSKAFPKDREDYVKGLATRPQFLRLSYLAQREFNTPEPPPVWVNAIIKTKIPAFDRLLVRFTQEQVDRWAREFELQSQHDSMADAAIGGRLQPPANYHACAPEVGSRCWAFDWCHGSEELRAHKFRQLKKGE